MRETVDNYVRYIMAILMGILVIDVVWQVFSRYVLGAPSVFTSEIARFLLIWVGMLGSAYVAGKNMHLAVDIFPEWLSEPNRRKLSIVINALVLCFVIAVMVVGGSFLVYYTLGQVTPVLRIQMGYVYLAVPFSGLLIVYYKLLDILSALQHSPNPSNN